MLDNRLTFELITLCRATELRSATGTSDWRDLICAFNCSLIGLDDHRIQ